MAQLKYPLLTLLVPHPSLKLQFLFFIFFTFSQADVNCSLSTRWGGTASIPYLEEAVPGSCATRHPIRGHSDTAHAVVVTSQHPWTTAQEGKNDVNCVKCPENAAEITQMQNTPSHIRSVTRDILDALKSVVTFTLSSLISTLYSPTLSDLSASQMLTLKSS